MQGRLREEGLGLLEFLVDKEQRYPQQEGSPLERELEEPQDAPVLVLQDMLVEPVRLELGLGTVLVRLGSGQGRVLLQGESDQDREEHRQEQEHRDREAWPPRLPQLPPPQLLPPSFVGSEGNKSAPTSSALLHGHLRPQFQL